MFSKLNQINIGDKIFLTDEYEREITYKVTEIFKVLPKETDCLSQKTNGKKEITLITCTASSRERVIVKGVEEV